MTFKTAARYASQPTIELNGGSAAPNRFSGMMPFGMGTSFPQAAPNPLAQIRPQSPGMANEQGIQQALQKAAQQMLLARLSTMFKSSDSTGESPDAAPVFGDSKPAGRKAAPVSQTATRRSKVTGGVVKTSPRRAAAAGAPTGLKTSLGLGGLGSALGMGQKLASFQPTPGLTANMPPAPMMPQPPMMPGGAMPPGAPPGMPPGGAGPVMPPLSPMGGQMPPQMGQGPPPPTAPMMDQPPTPLPANPRPAPASPKSSMQAQQEANMLGLLEAKQEPDTTERPASDPGVSELGAQNMAMDEKLASLKSVFEKLAKLPQEGGEDAASGAGITNMRGWQWKALQKSQGESAKGWMPRVFQAPETPLTELLASPGKQSLLGALAGAGVGGGLGAMANKVAPTGLSGAGNAAIGAGVGGLLGALKAYSHRRRENDRVMDALRQLPPGATVQDRDTLKKTAGNPFAGMKDKLSKVAPPPVTEDTGPRPKFNMPMAVPVGIGGGALIAALMMRLRKRNRRKTDMEPEAMPDTGGMPVPLQKQAALPGSKYVGQGLGWLGRQVGIGGARPTLSQVRPVYQQAYKGVGPVNNAQDKLYAQMLAREATSRHFGQQAWAASPVGRGYGAVQSFAGSPAAKRIGAQFAPTAGGALMGGMAGDDAGLGGGHVEDPFGLGFKFNERGMALGAGAFNPALRRLASHGSRSGRGLADAPLAGIRGSSIGSFGGSAIDESLGAFGVNVDPTTGHSRNTFGRLGALGGFGVGAGGRAMSALGRTGVTPGYAAGTSAASALRQGGGRVADVIRGTNRFGMGALDPMLGAISYIPRKLSNYVSGGGNWLSRQFGKPSGFNPNFMPPATGQAQRLGRAVGVAGLGGLGLGVAKNFAYGAAHDVADNAATNVFKERYPEVRDIMVNDMVDVADQYMGSRGFLDEHGQFDPTHTVNRKGGILNSVTSGADSLFASMGIDPRSLTPLQKIMIMGGAMGTAGGAAAGSSMLMGLGGASMLGGTVPNMLGHYPANYPQYPRGGAVGVAGHNPHQYQNEWLKQQQLQGAR